MPRNNEDFLVAAGFTPEEQSAAVDSAVEGAGNDVIDANTHHKDYHLNSILQASAYWTGDEEKAKTHYDKANEAHEKHLELTGIPLVNEQYPSMCNHCGLNLLSGGK